MSRFGRGLAGVVAAAFAALAATVVATPGISWAGCDRNMSHNDVTNACTPPPPMPAWYVPPPAYAPPFAAQDVPPPPPPRPSWSPNEPMWNAGFHQWGTYITGTWVPY
ncbi:hypothetical protein MRAB57_2420 [Mycobacterium rhizamassiliense]|jgi:hypothetical protein|uniref:Secreted protein antigen n=1 Tax=Mycobacterium rhizamassiliense TaxID=1841860 RepID=A0A2U3NSV6_9MYCO|nr:hypothetical protein [Mycobacterium rhizamassiliense]SPM34600.1 hypothetical protein MRAB57_2420 [Mycobacterium rhizamassiliense]